MENKCETCLKIFVNKKLLDNHKKINCSKKSYKCGACEKNFSSKNDLQLHKPVHGKRPFKCSTCDKSFRYPCLLKTHMDTHFGEKILECEHCKKRFLTKHLVESHLWVHASEKPYKCSSCTKSFFRKDQFEKHKKIHLNLNEFESDEHCKKRFLRKEQEESHCWVDASEKPYKCSFCTKSFVQKYNLENHKRIHISDFECKLCKIKFPSKMDLIKHLSVSEQSFKCKYCDKILINQTSLQIHERKHLNLKEAVICIPKIDEIESSNQNKNNKNEESLNNLSVNDETLNSDGNLKAYNEIFNNNNQISSNTLPNETISSTAFTLDSEVSVDYISLIEIKEEKFSMSNYQPENLASTTENPAENRIISQLEDSIRKEIPDIPNNLVENFMDNFKTNLLNLIQSKNHNLFNQ